MRGIDPRFSDIRIHTDLYLDIPCGVDGIKFAIDAQKQDAETRCEDYTTNKTQISKQESKRKVHFSCYAHERPSIHSGATNTNNTTERSDRGVTKREKRMWGVAMVGEREEHESSMRKSAGRS